VVQTGVDRALSQAGSKSARARLVARKTPQPLEETAFAQAVGRRPDCRLAPPGRSTAGVSVLRRRPEGSPPSRHGRLDTLLVWPPPRGETGCVGPPCGSRITAPLEIGMLSLKKRLRAGRGA